jgi:hypothetical protein
MKNGTTIRLTMEPSDRKDYVLNVNICEPEPDDETDNFPWRISVNQYLPREPPDNDISSSVPPNTETERVQQHINESSMNLAYNASCTLLQCNRCK